MSDKLEQDIRQVFANPKNYMMAGHADGELEVLDEEKLIPACASVARTYAEGLSLQKQKAYLENRIKQNKRMMHQSEPLTEWQRGVNDVLQIISETCEIDLMVLESRLQSLQKQETK